MWTWMYCCMLQQLSSAEPLMSQSCLLQNRELNQKELSQLVTVISSHFGDCAQSHTHVHVESLLRTSILFLLHSQYFFGFIFLPASASVFKAHKRPILLLLAKSRYARQILVLSEKYLKNSNFPRVYMALHIFNKLDCSYLMRGGGKVGSTQEKEEEKKTAE